MRGRERRLVAAVVALVSLRPLGLASQSTAGGAAFAQGVAARARVRSAILWTRLPEPGRYKWVVIRARDSGHRPITGGGTVTSSRDLTVHVKVGGLKPGTRYFYNFITAGGPLCPGGVFPPAPRPDDRA